MINNLTEEQIQEVLEKNVLGRIGCSYEGKTYVVPLNYAYDGKFIIAHSEEGMKIHMMRNNPQVCFEVDEMHSFTNWKSVIAWGEYQELTDERDRYYAMRLFVDRMMHVKISQSAKISTDDSGNVHSRMYSNRRPVIFRIVIAEKTGKYENE